MNVGRTDRTRITPERWQRLQALFERALPLDPDARAQLLLEECGTDSSLREQVLALLVASDDDGGELERRIDAATSITVPIPDLESGQTVGRYRIVRLIGRGGMGTVYLAERADQQYHQIVALKLMARGAFTGDVAGRFRAERQILARLNHPNIARLLDGGQMQDGTPYFVLEHVEGIRIDDYCTQKNLPMRARLPLIQQVCAAVQYAHQNLVVHRDLKPSNILVTEDGVPKLLDFGIAKLLTPQGDTNEPLTRLRDRVLTPEHASPEQFRGDPIGTAADIYSLGTLFYRLLCGLHPYDIQGRPIREIEMLICESRPPAPSERLLAEGDNANSPKAKALARELRGDLDNIVLRAMHRDPERRYSSAAALAQDIQNYLTGMPVQAQPDTWTYRAHKFLRRNAMAVASVATVVVVIATLITFYTMQLAAERDVAERERLAATSVSDFMVDVFRGANPNETKGELVTARAALEAATKRIDTKLANEPDLRFTLMRKMSDSYNGLGLWTDSVTLLEKMRDQQRAAFGNRSIQVARTLEAIGSALDNMGKFDDAAQPYEEAWGIRTALGHDRDAEAAEALSGMAKNMRSRLHLDAAMEHHRRALSIARELSPPNPRLLGIVLQDFAHTTIASGDYVAAERYARESIPLLKGVVNDGHDVYANTLAALGDSLRRQFKLAEAEKVFKDLIERHRQMLGDDHIVVGRGYNNYSGVLRARGDYAGAEHALREALRIAELQHNSSPIGLATSYHNLGSLHLESGDLPAALSELDQAISYKRASGGPRNPSLVTSLTEKAGVLRKMGQLPASKAVLDEAQSIAAEKLDKGDRRHDAIRYQRGLYFLAVRRPREAESELQAAVTGMRAQQDPIRLADALGSLAEALSAMGKQAAAYATALEAFDLRQKVLPAEHPAIAAARAQMAKLQIPR